MKIKIKSVIPIRYEQDDIISLCSAFAVTYISHEKTDFEINVEIVEDLTSEQIENIKSQLRNHVLNNIVDVSDNS